MLTANTKIKIKKIALMLKRKALLFACNMKISIIVNISVLGFYG